MTASLMDKHYVSPTAEDAEKAFVERDDWVMLAHCRNGDPDALFVRGAAQRRAAEICTQCPVVVNCRADALDNRVEFGVWGGLTERQRRAILRKYPNVNNWAAFFAQGGSLDEC